MIINKIHPNLPEKMDNLFDYVSSLVPKENKMVHPRGTMYMSFKKTHDLLVPFLLFYAEDKTILLSHSLHLHCKLVLLYILFHNKIRKYFYYGSSRHLHHFLEKVGVDGFKVIVVKLPSEAELSMLLLRLGLKDPLPVPSLDGTDSADTLGMEKEDEL